LSRPQTALNQVRKSVSGPWSGNAAHKAEKYFITSAKRDRNDRLQIEIVPSSGRRKLSPTPEMIRRLINGEIEIFVLTTQPDIAIDINKQVIDMENRYVIDFDKRGIKWTMREIPVFYCESKGLCVELQNRIYTLNEFFK
ncbi:MAG TPA: reaction center protein, partial [Chlorobaculum parvum]|nr:reaction center protein [Chlorobaculum parvum]